MEYDFREIEKKWKDAWNKNNVYKVSNDSNKQKCYVLDMFPYPSGAGLHVGHPLGYIASDIYARYKRSKGFNVLHPMGYDSFGLPAEQYALETGQHPAVTTENNIATFRSQLDKIGFSFDWSREVRTSDPAYYKWTQWIFLKLFNSWYNKETNKAEPIETLISRLKDFDKLSEVEKAETLMTYRLMYCSYGEVNWCEALGTVLANDEVINGRSERGGYLVVKKKLRQWYLRITEYADRLLEGLNRIEFSEAMKDMQTNWIGKSSGAEIDFKIQGKEEFKLRVYTTRPDTIFGVDFMVVAPEHELVKQITTGECEPAVEEYLNYVQSRSERERMAEKKISGVFTGAYALNPFDQRPIPVWISEYVLAGYGTGAIMAVPCGDERDHKFAEHFNLPITNIIGKHYNGTEANPTKDAILENSDFLNGTKMLDAIDIVIDRVEKEGIGVRKVNFRMHDAAFSRQRYWGEPIPIRWVDGIAVPLDESQLPLELPKVDSYAAGPNGEGPLANIPEWASGNLETNTMPGYAGSSWYFLRYMDPYNEKEFCSRKASDYWNQVDLYIGGTEHAVGHLLYSRMWTKVLYDLGYISFDEPFRKLVNQGMIQGSSRFVYRIRKSNKFVSHGLKSNYETDALHVDVNIVDGLELDVEAFKNWRKEFNDAEFILEDGKYITGAEVEKMSKRLYNTVNPDDIVERYGADTYRMYEMFLGPIEMSKPWDTKGIEGVYRFLKKLWRLFFDEVK
ncbi:MAG: leucine--tRNA ligase, partial [Chitinophagaceae bacterium]|nr:leucine--tRNA ligase [Chitinophagaceae bacterium]